MYPVIAKIGPLCIYSYGLMVALGFAAAIALSYRTAGSFGIDKEKVVDFGIFILIGGLIGARLTYVVSNFGYYAAHPAQIFDLTKGGLVWYGGFISGIIVGIIFVKINHIDFWDGADLLAPFIALAQALGRIGCFLNGCCYGVDAPEGYTLGVIFPNEDILRHPVQLYESAAMLALFVLLRKRQPFRRFKGEIFLAYAALYSLIRFVIEFFRGDNIKIAAGLSAPQFASAAIFFTCLTIITFRYISCKKKS